MANRAAARFFFSFVFYVRKYFRGEGGKKGKKCSQSARIILIWAIDATLKDEMK